MSFFDLDTWKVNGAAFLGFSSASMDLWFKRLEPSLNFLILVGQVAITLFTALYLFSKWRAIVRKRKK